MLGLWLGLNRVYHFLSNYSTIEPLSIASACVITLLINCRQLMLWLLALIRRRAARRPKISCLRWSPQIKIPPSVHVKGYLKPGCLAKKNFMTLAKTFFLQSQASDKIAPEKKSYLLESCWNEKKPPSKSFFVVKSQMYADNKLRHSSSFFGMTELGTVAFWEASCLLRSGVRLPGRHGLQ